MPNGNCFRCGEPGHWISDCPQKSKNAVNLLPSIYCPCGGGICISKVSNTRGNPGRRFFKCPAAQNCKFFKWCDTVTDEDIKFRPAFNIPACPCGSGPCRRVKVNSGPDSGRAYLICSVKKGFGACGFFQWEDDDKDFWEEADLIMSNAEIRYGNVNGHEAVVCEGVKESSVEDDRFSDVHSAAVAAGNQGIPIVSVVIQPEDLVVKTVHCNQPTNCALSESSFKDSLQLNVDEAMNDLVRDRVSIGGSVVTNHGDQATNCVLSESSFKGSCQWNLDGAINNIVRETVSVGGSVATNHGDQATNCALSESSFKDSLQLNVDVAMSDLVIDIVSSGSVVTNHGDQATVCALSKSSYIESCQVNVDEAVRDLVRNSVSSGDPVVTNHVDQARNCAPVDQAMSGLIRDTVSSGGPVVTNHVDQAMDCAPVDQAMSGLIRDTVSSHGTAVTNHERPVAGSGEAEWSFPNLQDLMEQHNSEKLQLEKISRKHDQMISAFMGSYSRLRVLHDKTFELKKALLEAEKEMAFCEAETLELGASSHEVAREMAESQKRMQETADKLRKEVDLLKKSEFVSMKRKRS